MTFEEELASPENEYIAVIGKYLKDRALTDPSVEENLKKESKSLKRCFQYIIDEARKVKKCDCAMVENEVVFGWAVHYYDEDNLKIDDVKKTQKTPVKRTKKDAIKRDDIKPVKESKKESKSADEGQLSLF